MAVTYNDVFLIQISSMVFVGLAVWSYITKYSTLGSLLGSSNYLHTIFTCFGIGLGLFALATFGCWAVWKRKQLLLLLVCALVNLFIFWFLFISNNFFEEFYKQHNVMCMIMKIKSIWWQHMVQWSRNSRQIYSCSIWPLNGTLYMHFMLGLQTDNDY